NLWASGYDVDGTDQTSLGQFSGRVQQTYKHSVPRFFVPEHGTMFTLALVRFPPTATKEIQYLRSEERFSRNAETDLVCRLLLEQKKNTKFTGDESDRDEYGAKSTVRYVHVIVSR